MDISNKVPPVQNPSAVKAIQSVQKAAATSRVAEKSNGTGDKVDISSQAREMQLAREQLAKLPDVDEDKVAQIKAKIQQGTYSVNGGQVASKMLAESLLKDM